MTLIKIKYEQEQDATADLPCTDDLEAHRGKLPTWLRQEWSPRGDQARPHGCTVRYHQLEGDSRPPPTPRTSPRPPLRGCSPRLAVSLPAALQSVLSCRTPAALCGGRILKEANASEPSPLRVRVDSRFGTVSGAFPQNRTWLQQLPQVDRQRGREGPGCLWPRPAVPVLSVSPGPSETPPRGQNQRELRLGAGGGGDDEAANITETAILTSECSDKG